jgi:hypothetical protein
MEKKRKKKPPKDINQLAKYICDVTVEGSTNIECTKEKNPAAVALGRLGGLKGGKARAEKLSAQKRKEIAKKAAAIRWADHQKATTDESSS